MGLHCLLLACSAPKAFTGESPCKWAGLKNVERIDGLRIDGLRIACEENVSLARALARRWDDII